MKNKQNFKPVRPLSKMLPVCFGKGKCCSRLRCPVKFPTHASRSGSHATMIAFCRGNCYFSSEMLKLYLTSSWIGKPIADRYCSFEAGPPRKCIYDGEKSHSGFPYCIVSRCVCILPFQYFLATQCRDLILIQYRISQSNRIDTVWLVYTQYHFQSSPMNWNLNRRNSWLTSKPWSAYWQWSLRELPQKTIKRSR